MCSTVPELFPQPAFGENSHRKNMILGGSEGELKIHGSGSKVRGLNRSRATHVVADWPSLVASPTPKVVD